MSVGLAVLLMVFEVCLIASTTTHTGLHVRSQLIAIEESIRERVIHHRVIPAKSTGRDRKPEHVADRPFFVRGNHPQPRAGGSVIHMDPDALTVEPGFHRLRDAARRNSITAETCATGVLARTVAPPASIFSAKMAGAAFNNSVRRHMRETRGGYGG